MSKFSTLLRRTTRVEPAPMGFTFAAGRTKHRSMLVTILVDSPSMDGAIAAADAGADSILFENGDLHDQAGPLKAITEAVTVPCGLRLKKASSASSKEARESGVDYLLFDNTDIPASLLLDTEIGFLLAADPDTPELSLRMMESLPLDALFIAKLDLPLTLKQQLELRRISGLSHKPLLARIDVAPLSEDLECLRDTGVAALLIEAGGDLPQRVSALHTAIENLPARPRRRAGRDEGSPVLPSVSHGREEPDAEEEE